MNSSTRPADFSSCAQRSEVMRSKAKMKTVGQIRVLAHVEHFTIAVSVFSAEEENKGINYALRPK